jgi:short-subunit dehydrogenase
MKIVITGHTRGLGAELSERFQQQDHEVSGFSLSTGHDIRKPAVQSKIVLACRDADVFVNNAYADESQIHLLNYVYKQWNDQPGKYIINIGSTASYMYRTRHHPYVIWKTALDETARQVQQFASWPMVLNFRPGTFVGPKSEHIDEPKMSVQTTADVIMYAWDNRKNFTILDIVYSVPPQQS